MVSSNGSSESYDPKATDFAALAQKIKASGADVVFVGAITGQGTAKLWKDIKAGAPNIQMFGPDGVNEKSWYDGTGASGNGTYLTFGGVDISQLQGAGKHVGGRLQDRPQRHPAAVLRDLCQGRRAGHPGTPSPRPATNDRLAVLKAVMGTSGLDTVIGATSFDPNGDVKGGVISSYQVGTSWPPEFKGVITQSK